MGESVKKVFKKRIGLVLTRPYLEALDYLVEKGFYMGHQVAIRDALRRLFQFHGIESFSDKGALIDSSSYPIE